MSNKFEDFKDYTVLYIQPENLNESADRRAVNSRPINGVDRGPGGVVNYDDPKLYMSTNFGRQLQSMLTNSNNFWAEVSDFGKYVVVTAGYHNTVSGRSATKHFVIAFDPDGVGTVFTSATKWRSISGVGQAASYIKSACNPLESSITNKI